MGILWKIDCSSLEKNLSRIWLTTQQRGEPLYNKYFPWPGQHLPWWNLPTVDITAAILDPDKVLEQAMQHVQTSCVITVRKTIRDEPEIGGVRSMRSTYRLQQYQRLTLLAATVAGGSTKSVVDAWADQLVRGADVVLRRLQILANDCGVLGFCGAPLSYTCPFWTRTSSGPCMEFSVISFPILDSDELTESMKIYKTYDWLLAPECTRKNALKCVFDRERDQRNGLIKPGVPVTKEVEFV